MLGTGVGPFGPPQAASLKVCWSCHVGVPCCDASGSPSAAAAAAAEAGAAAAWRAVSVDFAADGSLLLIAAVGGPEGGSAKLLIADLKAGCVSRVYECPEGGVSSARFVANSTAECLLGGAEGDTFVHLWDLAENRVCAAYGLPAPLTGSDGLVAHPRQRLFLCCCSNGLVLLFDVKRTQPLAGMHCSSPRPTAAFDSEGLVFAFTRSPTQIHLVNSELTDLQEFSAFDLSAAIEPGSCIASLCFSPDGEVLAVASSRQQLLLLNAFKGTQIARLCDAVHGDAPSAWPCSPSFSGNSLLLFWSRDTNLYAFRMPSAADSSDQQQQQQVLLKGLNANLLIARHGGHSDSISIAKASPVHSLVVTGEASDKPAAVAGGVLAIWQPLVSL